jgi:hypothetical protein
MNILPMSYYPMPSDDKSQIVALREAKTELQSKAQDVAQSGAGEQEKKRQLTSIDEKTEQLNAEIHKRQIAADQKRHEDAQQQLKTQQNQKTEDQQRLKAQQTKTAEAKQSAKTKEKHKVGSVIDRYV